MTSWRAMLVAVLIGWAAAAARAEDDNATMCATAAPELRRLAVEAAAFNESIQGALPPDLAVIDPDEAERLFRNSTGSAPLAALGDDYMIALVRLRDPMAEYAKVIAAMSLAAEACAAAQ